MAIYLAASDVRNFTNIGSEEFSDAQLSAMITQATNLIDYKIGRTWQGTSTATDQLYDGDGSTILFLDHLDIGTLSALSIDDDFDGTYTTVTASYALVYGSEGKLVLDTERYPAIQVDRFTKGRKTVKATYTYGNTTIPETVKRLALLIVSNNIKMDEKRQAEIDKLYEALSTNAVEII